MDADVYFLKIQIFHEEGTLVFLSVQDCSENYLKKSFTLFSGKCNGFKLLNIRSLLRDYYCLAVTDSLFDCLF